MNEKLKDVMRKISKLKAQYEGALKINSEHEAELAARLMNKLLTEYNLTLSEVEDGVQENENPMLHENLSGYTYKSIGGWWEHRLTYVICKWNFCEVYTYGNTYKRMVIVGRKENVTLVKWLVDMLKERFVALSKERYKDYLKTVEPWDKPMSKDKFQRSYLIGCAVGLDRKLTEQHEQEKREEIELSTKITALVVQNNAALQEYVKKQWGNVKAGRGYKENYDSARQSGIQDGKNTDINKPIAGGRQAAAGIGLLK